ncbi:hypothetical protein FRC10_012161 [Ceratobasidium sp. 414]|nr:hypothetical protein FRC10_012161 [Ceratobasidium sp. 414]
MPKKNQSRIAEQDLLEFKEGMSVCRVGIARGGSQFEVWDGEAAWLAELPKRFRNTLWIRRGSFVVVDTSNGSANANGIRGEIVFVLQKEHVSQLRKRGHWPSRLDETLEPTGTLEINKGDLVKEGANSEHREGNDADDSSDSELFQNNNRR